MFVFALLSSGVAMLFSLRVALEYSRVIAAMKLLREEDRVRLPPIIRDALTSPWAASLQSTIFHEIAVGDIGWADQLSFGSMIAATRRDIRWTFVGGAGAIIALFAQLALSRV